MCVCVCVCVFVCRLKQVTRNLWLCFTSDFQNYAHTHKCIALISVRFTLVWFGSVLFPGLQNWTFLSILSIHISGQTAEIPSIRFRCIVKLHFNYYAIEVSHTRTISLSLSLYLSHSLSFSFSLSCYRKFNLVIYFEST